MAATLKIASDQIKLVRLTGPCVIAGGVRTVRPASGLVVVPFTTTEYLPESLNVKPPMLSVELVEPVTFPVSLKLTPSFLHCQVNGPEPPATTEKVRLAPSAMRLFAGVTVKCR